ncbi:MAG: hypothetical protein HOQ30_07640 [Gemmatimonadaceae bacterium]|nr:hypothetical protein [Gemmatimonadaceae bacterium]
MRDLLLDVERLVRSIDDDVDRSVRTRSGPVTKDGLTSGFVHFVEKSKPAWLVVADGRTQDVIHQLIVVVRHKGFVAFCCSSAAHQDDIARAIRAQDNSVPQIAALAPVAPSLLNAAFVKGRTRTLWLSGLHRRTSLKPDAKVLSGLNLVDALSPLGDQSYAFSAVRCQLDLGTPTRPTIGITPRKSRIWAGPSNSWASFHTQVSSVLFALARADGAGEREPAPLPILAIPAVDVTQVAGAYEMLLLPPEMHADSQQLDDAATVLLERWSKDARFTVTATTSANFTARVELDDSDIGDLDFSVGVSGDGRAEIDVAASRVNGPALSEAAKLCRRPGWLTVYYDSGHTLVDGALFQMRYRDIPFNGWNWQSFANYDVHREKPLGGPKGKTVDFHRIGSAKSLFCWVHKHWGNRAVPGAPAWLTCDDGANEVADFVHFRQLQNGPPVLTLIHVKGSHSVSANRALSTTAFEVVVSQALKNLRALDRQNLLELLERGSSKATKLFAWAGGKREPDRTALLNALRNCGEDYAREVVIVQPSALKSVYVRKVQPGATYYRKRQLDALLSSAHAECMALGAGFTVVSDDR